MTYDLSRPMTLSLAPLTAWHVRRTFGWVGDPELRRMFLMRDGVTRKGHVAYFRKAFGDPSQRLYAIVANGVHIGNCGFKNISPDGGEGELWIYIGDPSMRGKGAGREATDLLIREGFERIGLETICLHVADFNLAARRMYLRLGFVEAPAELGSAEWKDRGCEIIRMKLSR